MNILTRVNSLLDRFRTESEPDLKVSEFSRIEKKEVIELIDWELRRIDEAKKTFGVSSWSLVVGFAGVVWALAAIPSLNSVDSRQILWSFFLLDSTLIAGANLWQLAIGTDNDIFAGRAVKSSVVGGLALAPSLVSEGLRFVLLFASTFAWPVGGSSKGDFCANSKGDRF